MWLRGFQWLAWLVYLTGCLLILSNTIADYRPDGPGIFILQKGGQGPHGPREVEHGLG